MFKSLLIQNYALIDRLFIEPDKGFNIITGETGAGKSIILGALGLLAGERADGKVLYTNDKCVVEATFEIHPMLQPIFEEAAVDYMPHTIIRREVGHGGKSRMFVNDTPLTLEAAKKITSQLFDIHSQHDTLLLADRDFQLDVIDTYCDTKTEIAAYKNTYDTYKSILKELATLREHNTYLQKEYDYNLFIYNELKEASLIHSQDYETMENELLILQNAENIKIKSEECISTLSGENGIIYLLNTALAKLADVTKTDNTKQSLKDRLYSTLIEIKDINNDLENYASKLSPDPDRMEQLQSRLNIIYKLQKKHHTNTVAELQSIMNIYEQKVNDVAMADDKIRTKEVELDSIKSTLQKQALLLTQKRKAGFEKLEAELTSLLKELGMPSASFAIHHSHVEYQSSGTDNITFMFSANKGIAPSELKKVASGGELSRLMFALKYLQANHTAMPTIIFDEIDTGISGEIAHKMGQMMKKMADNMQLITITHMHAIAAQGNVQYHVYKYETQEKTVTHIKQLTAEERAIEISKLISGNRPSEASYISAKELLEMNIKN
ncbi:MAG: DNA repair protein RecN [Cytophagales bacterium]|nr:DNA repair protein RecN [Cytophagales bacterium]